MHSPNFAAHADEMNAGDGESDGKPHVESRRFGGLGLPIQTT